MALTANQLCQMLVIKPQSYFSLLKAKHSPLKLSYFLSVWVGLRFDLSFCSQYLLRYLIAFFGDISFIVRD